MVPVANCNASVNMALLVMYWMALATVWMVSLGNFARRLVHLADMDLVVEAFADASAIRPRIVISKMELVIVAQVCFHKFLFYFKHFYTVKMLEFIKAVSDTVFGMINASYYGKAFDIYQSYVSGKARLPSSSSDYKLLNPFEFIKVVSDTVFDMINVAYCAKPLILNGAMRLSLSRLFLTLYLT